MSAQARRSPGRSLLALSFLLTIATLHGQDPWGPGWGGWRSGRVQARTATAGTFDGGFNFCRLMYDSVRWERGGMGWWTDYPTADINLSVRLAQLTSVQVGRDDEGTPKHVVVRPLDAELFRCPFLVIEDAGTAEFSDEEAAQLRAYLLKGGFLWVDDFWGTAAWDAWVEQLAKVLPPDRFPVHEVSMDHPIFHTLYDVPRLPQIPSIQHWRRNGDTSERGADSAVPDARGVSDAHGRLMVFMTHDTDIADAWEREGESEEFFTRFSVDGYAVGVNVVLYALTH